MYGSGAVSCSCSLLIRGPNLARCQAEAPLIALCRFPKPALSPARHSHDDVWSNPGRADCGDRTIYSWRLLQSGARAIVQLSLWGLLSQEGEALVRQSLRQPLLRQLLRPRGLLQRLGLLRSSLLELLQRQSLWP